MKYEYRSISAPSVLRHFPICLPCGCFEDDSKIVKVPRYDVRIKYGTTNWGSRGQIIKEITLDCDCCGAHEIFDVERYEVYENDLSW